MITRTSSHRTYSATNSARAAGLARVHSTHWVIQVPRSLTEAVWPTSTAATAAPRCASGRSSSLSLMAPHSQATCLRASHVQLVSQQRSGSHQPCSLSATWGLSNSGVRQHKCAALQRHAQENSSSPGTLVSSPDACLLADAPVWCVAALKGDHRESFHTLSIVTCFRFIQASVPCCHPHILPRLLQCLFALPLWLLRGLERKPQALLRAVQ